MYVGGGQVIEARHTGDVVKLVSLATYAWRAAGRLAT
jgi:hypothetical protein